MSQPFKLFRLQQIDSHLDKIRLRLREIDVDLRADEHLREADKRVADTLKKTQEASKILHKAENEVETIRIKIEQTESTLYGGKVRNPKELQDLQNESAALKRYQLVLEDRQLEAMVALEEADKDHREALDHQQHVHVSAALQNTALIAEQTSLNKEGQVQESERKAASSGIPEEDLNLYEQLRRSRNGVAVARIIERSCSACGSTLNAALLVAAYSPNQITRCDTCGRIFYAG